jgi:hypothetical protein
MISAPACAKSFAVAVPIPPVAPVISAVRPAKLNVPAVMQVIRS